MQYGLIGEHLPHSFSKVIHGLIAKHEGLDAKDYQYELKELSPGELPAFMKAKAFKGINVTIPYKEKVIPYLDYTDEAALKIGAVNTIVNKDGRLYGYNTDCYGLRDLITGTGTDLNGKKVLILGTGGTSKTARYVCNALKAKQIIVVSRGMGHGQNESHTDAHAPSVVTYDEAYELHGDADVIINTTPVGMFPKAGMSPVDLSRFDRLECVIDVIYNPLRTSLILDAKERGLKCAGGLRMLVTQAVYAYRLFKDMDLSGQPRINELTDIIYEHIYSEKRNIVLTGMPGSGKTTIGKLLAGELYKRYVDTDDLITEREGRQISDIFAKDGEEYFRGIESGVIEDISADNGLVIATGGGAILKESNIRALKSNGTIIFIDRPLEDIRPTDDRPLSSDADMLCKRYNERYDIYCATCDIRVANTGSIEDTLNRIKAAVVNP